MLLAIIWLSLLILVAAAYLWVMVRRSPYTMWENVLYAPTYIWGRLLWRVRFTNAAPAAMLGGAILVANHRSSVDPFFVQLSAGRRVHWMVAREYCENIVFGPILRVLQVIPTNRSGMDTKATRLAIRLASEGKLVGMFPEGRLNHTPHPLVSIRPGAALVAMRAGVPLIPLLIEGSPYRREVWSPLTMPAQVTITFGQPIDPGSHLPQNAQSSKDAPDSTLLNSNGGDSATNGDDSLSTSSSPELALNSSNRVELAEAERMMMQWGQQVLTMAGQPNYPIVVAGRSRLRKPEVALEDQSVIEANEEATNDSA